MVGMGHEKFQRAGQAVADEEIIVVGHDDKGCRHSRQRIRQFGVVVGVGCIEWIAHVLDIDVVECALAQQARHAIVGTAIGDQHAEGQVDAGVVQPPPRERDAIFERQEDGELFPRDHAVGTAIILACRTRMEAKALFRSLVPPLLWGIGKACKRTLLGSPEHYAYAPRGWDTPLPGGTRSEDYWTIFIAHDIAAFQAMMARVENGEPAFIGKDYDFRHVAFAYALALSADEKQRTTVLDYGGSLGDYLWHGKFLLPGTELDYHCKELPAIAAAGRQVNPAVTWHTDDTCLL